MAFANGRFSITCDDCGRRLPITRHFLGALSVPDRHDCKPSSNKAGPKWPESDAPFKHEGGDGR